MKFLTNKTLALIVIALSLFALHVDVVAASSPHVIVRVQDEQGVPISGVNVLWTDAYKSYWYQTTAGGSYEVKDELGKSVTINTGEALFRSWDTPPENGGFPDRSQTGPQFDNDFISSTPTVPQWQVSAEAASKGRFGCGQNAHTFTATAPQEMQLSCTPITVDLQNLPTTNTFTIKCKKLICPGNIKQISCDQKNKTVTVGWDAPPGGADGYKVYFDAEPVGVANSLDILNSDLSNQLSRTQAITFDQRYLLRVKSLKTVDGQSLESESCLAELRCNGAPTPPPSPSPCKPGSPNCPGEGELDEFPTATLTGRLCPVKPSPFYYDYTMSNIDTKENPFFESRLMISFVRNSQTKQILNFLNGSDVINKEIGFSRWNELGRNPIDGDYFGFYVQKYTAAPTKAFRLDDSTRIGSKNQTIGDLRNFLEENNLPTQFIFKANLASKFGISGVLFNSDIPAGPISLAKTTDAICNNASTCVETAACVEDIVITPPVGDYTIPVNNKITLNWTSSAVAGTQYEVILYNTDKYSNAAEAYADTPPTSTPDLQYRVTTLKKASFNITQLGSNLRFAVRARKISCPIDGSSTVNCDWTEQNVQLGYTVKGNFYLDNSCSNTSQLQPLTGTISVNNATVTPITLNDENTYSLDIPDTGSPQRITLNIAGNEFECADGAPLQCPASPSSGTCYVDVNKAGTKHFFVQSRLSNFKSWWQVRGGLVFANTGIVSQLPLESDGGRAAECILGACEPFLVRREYFNSNEGSGLTAGIPMVYQGGFSSNINGWWTHRGENTSDPQAHAENTSNLLTGETKEDFEFFKNLLTTNVNTITGPVTITQLPAGQVIGDAKVLYYEGDLTVKPSTTIALGNGDKRVILVKGNIRFETEGANPVTQVTQGGFLAFIASGDITFGNQIGNETPNLSNLQPNLEGVFIADNNLVFESFGQTGGDKQFIGAGTFVGWADVKLNRRFDNPNDPGDLLNLARNTNMPVETVFFRPDFVVNAPEFMRSSSYTWKEVN